MMKEFENVKLASAANVYFGSLSIVSKALFGHSPIEKTPSVLN